MLFRSKSRSAPRSDLFSASRALAKRYVRKRSKSTRSSKSTAIVPGAGMSIFPPTATQGRPPGKPEDRTMTSRRRFIESTAALGSLAVSPAAAFAQSTPTNVRVIFFGVASNLPVWCGIAKGFFAKQNLNVTTEITPSSVYMFQHLSAGDFDIAVTAMDNVVAYDEGQGAPEVNSPSDFVAFMGGDSGMLSLWSRPDIRGYADLKG